MPKRTPQDEYKRMRKNLSNMRSYYRKKGIELPELPLTPKDYGIKDIKPTGWVQFTTELRSYKESLQSLIASKYRAQNKEYAPYNQVVLDNFRSNLVTRKYAKGSSIVSRWFEKTLDEVGGNAMVEAIEQGQMEDVTVDRFVKYASDEYALNYVGDMTRILYDKGYIGKQQLEEILTDSDYISEENSTFFDDFIMEL